MLLKILSEKRFAKRTFPRPRRRLGKLSCSEFQAADPERADDSVRITKLSPSRRGREERKRIGTRCIPGEQFIPRISRYDSRQPSDTLSRIGQTSWKRRRTISSVARELPESAITLSALSDTKGEKRPGRVRGRGQRIKVGQSSDKRFPWTWPPRFSLRTPLSGTTWTRIATRG